MKKNLILVTLLFLIATVGFTQSNCDPNTPTYYTTSITYIYQRAKTSSAIVTKIPLGEKVNVIDSDDYPNPNMWLICHQGKTGYAMKKLLSYDKVEPGQTDSSDPDVLNQEKASEGYAGLFGGDAISGIATGAGTIGGGLENRGGAGPAIEDTSQEQGKVVIRICVNKSGKVISADFTQRGSTTNSRSLIRLARKNATLYTFNPSAADKQCGTIAYNFRIQ